MEQHALWAKYHLHGDFPDEIVGAALKGGMVWGNMFHTYCRDFYAPRRHDADGGRGAMLELFRRAASIEDPMEVARQIHAGVLCRVRAVFQVLCRGELYGPELPQIRASGSREAEAEKEAESEAGLTLEENNESSGGGGGEEEEEGLVLEENDAEEKSGDEEEEGLLLEENAVAEGGCRAAAEVRDPVDDAEEEELLLEDNSYM